MKSIRDFFGLNDKSRQDQAVLRSEAKQFKTPSEVLPIILKYVFFATLATLNFRLFVRTVGGIYGILIGCAAILGETLAIYSIHNFSRSSGWHRWALGIGGGALAIFAMIHGTFSFFDLIAGDIPFGDAVHVYAKQYAFPILFSLIGLTAIALKLTHPKNLIRLAQASAHSEILIDRAKAASELELMYSKATVERAHIDRLNEKIKLDREYLGSLQKTIENEQAKINLIRRIPDRELREKMAADLGIDLGGQFEDRGQLPN